MLFVWIALGLVAYCGMAVFIGRCLETPDDDEIEFALYQEEQRLAKAA